MDKTPLTKLREFRENQTPPMSLGAASTRLGVSRAAISRWESGDRFPDKQYWPKLQELTGLSILEMMEAAE